MTTPEDLAPDPDRWAPFSIIELGVLLQVLKVRRDLVTVMVNEIEAEIELREHENRS